jgi:hypothetical protein
MGEILTLEMECIDSTELRHETDLFGPKKPYIGYDQGSPLNNFLAKMSGKRCIVFLDEFEKTTRDVQNALLIPFDEGTFTCWKIILRSCPVLTQPKRQGDMSIGGIDSRSTARRRFGS